MRTIYANALFAFLSSTIGFADCPKEILDQSHFVSNLRNAKLSAIENKFKFGHTDHTKWAIVQSQKDALLAELTKGFFLTKISNVKMVWEKDESGRTTRRCVYTATIGVLGNPAAKTIDFYMTLVQ